MQIKLNITIPKAYIVVKNGAAKTANLDGIMKMVKKAEKNNVLLSKDLVMSLATLETNDFKEIKIQFDAQFTKMEGQFLRSVFATGEEIEDETFTYNDFVKQISHYFVSYGLGEVDCGVFEIDEKRKVQISNISKRKDKQDTNNTFKIIDVKTVNDFVQEVQKIIVLPIVFGTQQIEFIQEAHRTGLLEKAITSDQTIKVKENLFQLITIVGKEFVKNNAVLNTVKDVLRYAYFVSGEDFKTTPVGTKFKLKTSDKKVIMASLNRVAKRDTKNAFGDMRPNKSQWLSVSKNLFPGSTKFKNFSAAQGIFDYLRNGRSVETFNTITQALIKEKKFSELAKHLGEKPGELLRSLDMIIRNSNKQEIDYLITTIKSIQPNPKLVVQVRKWLEYRTEHEFASRTFKVKGKPVTIEDKPLKKLKTKRTMKVVKALRCVLIQHLKGKSLFGTQLKQIEEYELNQLKVEGK